MFIPVQLLVEKREARNSVETCPLNYKSGDSTTIYGKFVSTWTMENGTYARTYEYSSNEYVGDSESCPTVNSSTTAVPGFDYGGVISNSDVFTLPLSKSDVSTHLAGIPPSWGGWSAIAAAAPISGEGGGAFSLLNNVIEEPAGELLISNVGIVSYGPDTASILGSRTLADFRFTLQVPVACQVVYQIGSQGELEYDYTWGAETTLTVSTTPQTVSVAGEEGYYKRFRLVRVIGHPWA